MRPIVAVALASLAVAALFAAPPGANALDFQGRLAIEIGTTLPPLEIGGAGQSVLGTRDGAHLSSMAFGAGVFTEHTFVVPVTDPGAAPIRGLQLTVANDPASLVEDGTLGGTMSLRGAVKVCLFGPCNEAVANIAVPLTPVGLGGTALVTDQVNLTVVGAPWTTASASIGTITAQGGARGPNGEASSTAQPGGQLSLVTPVFVSTSIAPSAVVPVFGFLRLGFGSIFFPICDDGVDNDGDGLTDFPEDPGCASDRDESESDPTRPCDDGLDNDGDGKTDFPADPGCATRADTTEGPDLTCDVAMNASFYRAGDTVSLTSLRFANLQSSSVPVRLRLQLKLPAVLQPLEVVDAGANGSFAIPGNFDRQLAPATMFTVTATNPPLRGSFEWRCALEDPATGEVIFEDRAAFNVQ